MDKDRVIPKYEELTTSPAMANDEPERSLTVYVGMPYRGVNGDAATSEEISDNIRDAVRVYDWLCSHFPSCEFYLPHTDHALQRYNLGLELGFCTSDQIIDKCCEIMLTKETAIFLKGPTSGMLKEMTCSGDHGQPHKDFDWDDPYINEMLSEFFAEVRAAKCAASSPE